MPHGAPGSHPETSGGLPLPLTSFVGRDAEQARVEKVLAEFRLVTLAGAGGVGKTRLALAAAEALADRWPDGVCWVDLGSMVDPEQVISAVTAATRVLVHPAGDPRRALVAQLRQRRQLVFLDTCEHLLATCAELVDLLLRECPGVSVLATSREPLGVSGEVVWRVPPMDSEHGSRLFAERAALVIPEYSADGAEQMICEQLDGVPLAIELAAAWMGVLSPGEIAARLRDRSMSLTGGPRFAAERHRSLTASLAWSYDLLDETDRRLFRRTAVFAGGFDLAAASAVCADDADDVDVLNGLRRLVDKSLLTTVTTTGSARFRLLDTVREYAAGRLEQAGEAAELHGRHLDHYLRFARVAEVELERDQDPWRVALQADHDNLRAALTWGLAQDPQRGRELAAALSRFWFVCGHTTEGMGFLRQAIDLAADDRTSLQAALLSGAASMAAGQARGGEAAELAERGIEIATAVADDRHRGRCLTWAAHRWYGFDSAACHELASEAGRFGALADDPFTVEHAAILRARTFTSRDRHAQALAEIAGVCEQASARGERGLAAFAAGIEIWADLFTGDIARAVRLSRQALAMAEPLGDHFTAGHVNLALALALSGDLDEARAAIEPAIRSVGDSVPGLYRWLALVPGLVELWQGDLGAAHHWLTAAARFAEPATDNWHVALALPPLAGTLRRLERPEEAREVAERAAALAQALDVPHSQAEALDELGHLARDRGSRGEATRLYRRALAIRVEHDLRTFWPDSLDALASVADDPVTAVRLRAAGDSGRTAVGRRLPPVDEADHAASLASLRSDLDADTFDGAWSAGASLTLDDAVAYVSRRQRGSGSSSSGWQSLSPTEGQVVELVVAGQTNPEIGARLFMSRSTVKTHLTHIYAKLSVANRAELAAIAGRQHASELRHRPAGHGAGAGR